jgi:hypothetical protein
MKPACFRKTKMKNENGNPYGSVDFLSDAAAAANDRKIERIAQMVEELPLWSDKDVEKVAAGFLLFVIQELLSELIDGGDSTVSQGYLI